MPTMLMTRGAVSEDSICTCHNMVDMDNVETRDEDAEDEENVNVPRSVATKDEEGAATTPPNQTADNIEAVKGEPWSSKLLV